ncbi:MAG: RNA polymerase sigma factor [Thermoanaerobaculia bacterium]
MTHRPAEAPAASIGGVRPRGGPGTFPPPPASRTLEPAPFGTTGAHRPLPPGRRPGVGGLGEGLPGTGLRRRRALHAGPRGSEGHGAGDLRARLPPSRRPGGGRPLLPWLLRIARNACVDRLRRLKVRTPDHPVPVEEGPDIPLAGPTPEEDAIAGSRERLLYRALGTLAEHYREMIVLKEIQGLKLEEICDLLDLPMGTAKSRSHRAKLELARAVRELQPDFGAAS